MGLAGDWNKLGSPGSLKEIILMLVPVNILVYQQYVLTVVRSDLSSTEGYLISEILSEISKCLQLKFKV